MINILVDLFKSLVFFGYVVTCLLIILLTIFYAVENITKHKPFGIIKSFTVTISIDIILLLVGIWLENLLGM